MSNYSCEHWIPPFNSNPFGEEKEPTPGQISNYKLYKCEKCGEWYSFFGVTMAHMESE